MRCLAHVPVSLLACTELVRRPSIFVFVLSGSETFSNFCHASSVSINVLQFLNNLTRQEGIHAQAGTYIQCMSIQRPRQTELVICMMGGCGELRHCSRTAIWLVSFHGGRWTFRVQEVPDKNGIVMRAAHYLEVIKLKSEHSTSVLLLWGVCVCEMCVCGGGVRCEWREWGVKVSRRYTHTHTCSLQTDTMITSPRVFWDRWHLQECVGPVQPGSPTPWWHWRGSKIMSCSNENNYLNFPQSH